LSKIIVTAALPYAYSIPHLGNFVGSILPADVYYKYLYMSGHDVIFISGSDQHGTPIELKAITEKVDPLILADQMHKEIEELFKRLECTFTKYGKTHCDANKELVYEIFNMLKKNNYIKEVESIQAFCNIDKRFITDRFIEGTCPYCNGHARGDQCDDCGKLLTPQQLINPVCKICGKSDISFINEKNLALDLPKLELDVRAFIVKESSNNWTKNTIKKSLSFLDEGLHAREITRMMKWGFPVPLKGYENYVFYVWFDAPIGYIGITKDWNPTKWKDYWFDANTKLIQFMGKDNIEFHTIMWPAMLIGSKLGFVLPKTIRASEFLLTKEFKFSKSKGVGLNIKTALEIADADYWRFSLMYIYPETSDSEFSIEIFEEIINKIMNDKIGNLINRVLIISQKNAKFIDSSIEPAEEHIKEIEKFEVDYILKFESIELREALRSVIALAEYGNMIMSKYQPWAFVKRTDNDLIRDFSMIMNLEKLIIYKLGILLWPFTPKASMQILSYFGFNSEPILSMLDVEAKSIEISSDKEIKRIFSKLSDEQKRKLKELK
jgi:methionyl-tRNA synthetase